MTECKWSALDAQSAAVAEFSAASERVINAVAFGALFLMNRTQNWDGQGKVKSKEARGQLVATFQGERENEFAKPKKDGRRVSRTIAYSWCRLAFEIAKVTYADAQLRNTFRNAETVQDAQALLVAHLRAGCAALGLEFTFVALEQYLFPAQEKDQSTDTRADKICSAILTGFKVKDLSSDECARIMGHASIGMSIEGLRLVIAGLTADLTRYEAAATAAEIAAQAPAQAEPKPVRKKKAA